ncbi:MAG: TIGR03668 family PPOX class F420-dependent oxidoreductase [Acidimicrobiales bacterium]
MDLVCAKQRVRDARVGRLGTVRPDGRPHLVPVCFVLREEIVYTAVDAKPKSTLLLRRLQNIEATPSTCLLIDHYDESWAQLWWVRLDGFARVVGSGPEAQLAKNDLKAKYPQYQTVDIPGSVIALEIAAWVTWP